MARPSLTVLYTWTRCPWCTSRTWPVRNATPSPVLGFASILPCSANSPPHRSLVPQATGLPLWNKPPASNTALAHAAAIRCVFDDHLADKPRSVSAVFGPHLDALLRIPIVASSNDLPPVWAALAATPRGYCRLLLGQQCWATAEQLYLAARAITLLLLTRIMKVEKGQPHQADLLGGLSPFLCSARPPSESAATAQLNQEYSLLISSIMAPDLGAFQCMMTRAGITPLCTGLTILQSLAQLIIFLITTLGHDHTV